MFFSHGSARASGTTARPRASPFSVAPGLRILLDFAGIFRSEACILLTLRRCFRVPKPLVRQSDSAQDPSVLKCCAAMHLARSISFSKGTKDRHLTNINVFTVVPRDQQKMIDLLVEATEETMKHLPRFVSASIHKGLDGGGWHLCSSKSGFYSQSRLQKIGC